MYSLGTQFAAVTPGYGQMKYKSIRHTLSTEIHVEARKRLLDRSVYALI